MKYLFILFFPLFIFAEEKVFYYDNKGNPQYLKQIYDQSVENDKHILKLTNITDKFQWLEYRNAMAQKFVSVWPVVSYGAKSPLLLNGKIGLVFKDNVTLQEQKAVIKKFNLSADSDTRTFIPDYHLFLLPAGADPFEAAQKLFESGKVEWAQPDWLQQFEIKALKPNDPYFGQQWHISKMSADWAWETTKGTRDIKIAVIDSGVEITHPDLKNNILPGYNLATTDSSKQNDPTPEKGLAGAESNQIAGHGTCVAGIIGASGDNGIGIAGECWNCSILPIKFLNADNPWVEVDRIVKAVGWAVENNASIINNSWGAQDTDDNGNCIDLPFDNYRAQAVKYAKENGRNGLGTIITWAAGNSNCDTARDPNFQNHDILVISAVTKNNGKESYSNYGDAVDIAAYDGVITTDILGKDGFNSMVQQGPADTDYTTPFAGTSASAPVAAGAVALMLSANPTLTFAEAIRCVKLAADKSTAACQPGGWAMPQDSDPYAPADKERSPCFGYGIINAKNMVQIARNGTCGNLYKGCAGDEYCSDGLVCDPVSRECVKEVIVPDEKADTDTGGKGCGCSII